MVIIESDQILLDLEVVLESFETLDVTKETLESLGYIEVVCDNSYNYGSDFKAEVNYTVMVPSGSDGDWLYNPKAVFFLEFHNGGDIRGNYSKATAYLNSDELIHILLTQHVGLRFDPESPLWDCDEYTTSYQSEPQYHFFKRFETVEVEDDYLIVKDKTDGSIHRVWPEHPAL